MLQMSQGNLMSWSLRMTCLLVQRDNDMHNRRLGSFILAPEVLLFSEAYLCDRIHTGIYQRTSLFVSDTRGMITRLTSLENVRPACGELRIVFLCLCLSFISTRANSTRDDEYWLSQIADVQGQRVWTMGATISHRGQGPLVKSSPRLGEAFQIVTCMWSVQEWMSPKHIIKQP